MGRENTSIAIVISQAALVILTVFAGGIFIPFDEVWINPLNVSVPVFSRAMYVN